MNATDTDTPAIMTHEQLVRRVHKLEAQLRSAEQMIAELGARVMNLEGTAERSEGAPAEGVGFVEPRKVR